MIFIYILIAVLLIFIILLLSPLKIIVSCSQNKPYAEIRYLFVKKTVFPLKKKQKKSDDSDKQSEKNDKNKKNGKEKKRKSIIPKEKNKKITFFINVLKSSGKALKHFTKRITIDKIIADIDISDEDACKCAVKFGRFNFAIYNILNFIAQFIIVNKEHININCVFNKPKCVYNFSFTVKFTPYTVFLSALAFIFTFLVNNIKAKKFNTAESLQA